MKDYENTDKHEVGQCPVCGSDNVDYGVAEITDDAVYYPMTCKDCGAEYQEFYDLTFIGHVNIQIKEKDNG